MTYSTLHNERSFNLYVQLVTRTHANDLVCDLFLPQSDLMDVVNFYCSSRNIVFISPMGSPTETYDLFVLCMCLYSYSDLKGIKTFIYTSSYRIHLLIYTIKIKRLYKVSC